MREAVGLTFRTPLLVLHITTSMSLVVAFALLALYSERVGIEIGIESDLIQPQRSFHSPLTASR
jgi:hypothetical protein